mmetsp:Transcript_27846/g.69921  ORF Transcript_27846/g.69921 Transcript_27846/m.69921 type:complete len:279 (+) Transcript_27846:1553-2389(+)
MTRRFLRSMSKISLRPGRCTLTITCSPVVFNLARCTCPKEAAASATSAKSSYTCSTGRPSSCSRILRAIAVGNGGTRSCSFSSSVMKGLDSTSTRVENCWPILMNVGPRRSNPRRNQVASTSVRASFLASVNPPLYVNLRSRVRRRNTKLKTKDQISSVRTKVPTDLRRSKFRGGSDTSSAATSAGCLALVEAFFPLGAAAAAVALKVMASLAWAGAAPVAAAAGEEDSTSASSSCEIISVLHSSSCRQSSISTVSKGPLLELFLSLVTTVRARRGRR